MSAGRVGQRSGRHPKQSIGLRTGQMATSPRNDLGAYYELDVTVNDDDDDED